VAVDFDLDAYFARIGYSGPRRPDLTTLTAINACQPAAIPFENLDPLLDRPVPLDLQSLQAKLVGGKRGGWCYELNSLLAAALEALGFSVTRLGCRVRWRAPPERPDGARSHMALCVNLDDGPYLVDVGFGGRLFAAPIAMRFDEEQRIGGDIVRLRQSAHHYTLQVQSAGEWGDLYRFSLEPQVGADYEVASWYLSTHPTSFFRGNLLAERLTPECRLSLFNTRLTRIGRAGDTDVQTLTSASELAATLEEEFGLALPIAAWAIWERILKD
jgi:N-hydroxyarylamine O-acetyltransferase